MARTLEQIHADLEKVETSLGSPPANPTVAKRLTDLETTTGNLGTSVGNLRSQIDTLSNDLRSQISSLRTRVDKLEEDVKPIRPLALGVAATAAILTASLTLVKFDIQLIKVDLTLWKKIDEKHPLYRKLADGIKNPITKILDKINQERVDERKKKADEAKIKKDLEERTSLRRLLDPVYYQKTHVDGLHKGIRRARDEADKANNAIDKLKQDLRDAGKAGAPKQPPQGGKKGDTTKKQVTDLRASVTSLSKALAGI
uniref:Uncharacterized protein n=1 Tax=Streptomyces sp. NBC_00093 TaxID=2975649 RepID=A0AAU2A038_9ACTN